MTDKTTASKTRAEARTADQDTHVDPVAASRMLHAAEPVGTPTIAMAFGDDVWERWVNEVKTNPAYRLPDPDNPQEGGMTGTGGANPPKPIIVEYGPGAHEYISTVFDSGQVVVQNGSDPSGKAWKFPESAWRRFVAHVRGEEDKLPPDPTQDGPTMHEAAADQNARTGARLQADRDANAAARDRAEVERDKRR